MKPAKFQGLMLTIILALFAVLFAAVMVALSVLSPTSTRPSDSKPNNRLHSTAMLPSTLTMPARSDTPAVLSIEADDIDIEVDEMGLHIVDSSILKVWRNEKTGEHESELIKQR